MTKNTGWIAADDVNRLVREIDVALNGVDAAPQAKLCDVTAQVKKAAREFGPILQVLGAPPKPTGAVPPLDRDAGGRVVREAWMRWALTQACPKPSWLVPYDDLSEADKEADRQIFEACAGRATAADGVPAAWREFVTELANTAGVQISGNWLSQRAKSLLEAFPKNSEADDRGKCAHCGVLCSIGAVIPDGRWVCSHDCHVLLSRAEGRGSVLKTPEGWQITRNVADGIRIDDANGSWLSMPPTTPQDGHVPLAQRLLYGLAEALLTAAPTPQQPGQLDGWRKKAAEWLKQKAVEQEQTNAEHPRHAAAYKEWRDRPTMLRMLAQDIATVSEPQTTIKRNCPPPSWMFPDDDLPSAVQHGVRRLHQLISKASFSHAADKHSALELVARLAPKQGAVITSDRMKGYLTSDTDAGNLQVITPGEPAGKQAVGVLEVGPDGNRGWCTTAHGRRLPEGEYPLYLYPSPMADAELIERFRIAARALIGIRQPPAPEGQQRPVYAEDVETMADVLCVLESLAQQPAVSNTTAALIDMLRQRDAKGLKTYGTTLDRTDLSQAEWLQHMAEELLDGAGYALAALRTLKDQPAEFYEDTDGDLYLDLGGRGLNGERFMRRYANDDRDWVSAAEFALLTPFNPSPSQQNEQEKS